MQINNAHDMHACVRPVSEAYTKLTHRMQPTKHPFHVHTRPVPTRQATSLRSRARKAPSDAWRTPGRGLAAPGVPTGAGLSAATPAPPLSLPFASGLTAHPAAPFCAACAKLPCSPPPGEPLPAAAPPCSAATAPVPPAGSAGRLFSAAEPGSARALRSAAWLGPAAPALGLALESAAPRPPPAAPCAPAAPAALLPAAPAQPPAAAATAGPAAAAPGGPGAGLPGPCEVRAGAGGPPGAPEAAGVPPAASSARRRRSSSASATQVPRPGGAAPLGAPPAGHACVEPDGQKQSVYAWRESAHCSYNHHCS